MTSIGARVVRDVEQIQAFMERQQGILSEERFADLQQNQFESMQNRLDCHTLDLESLTQLSDLFAAGPWTEAQQDELNASVGENASRTHSTTGRSRQNQQIADMLPLLSNGDLEILGQEDTGCDVKLECVATRLVSRSCSTVSMCCIHFVVFLMFYHVVLLQGLKSKHVFITLLGS